MPSLICLQYFDRQFPNRTSKIQKQLKLFLESKQFQCLSILFVRNFHSTRFLAGNDWDVNKRFSKAICLVVLWTWQWFLFQKQYFFLNVLLNFVHVSISFRIADFNNEFFLVFFFRQSKIIFEGKKRKLLRPP